MKAPRKRWSTRTRPPAGEDPHLFLCFNAADVERLMADGAVVDAPNALGDTPLHRACAVGLYEVAVALLRHGASPLGVDGALNTPLHAALAPDSWVHLTTQKNLVALLLAHGADPNAFNRKGKTALHLAAAMGAGDVCEALVQAGADLAARRRSTGKTPACLLLEKVPSLMLTSPWKERLAHLTLTQALPTSSAPPSRQRI